MRGCEHPQNGGGGPTVSFFPPARKCAGPGCIALKRNRQRKCGCGPRMWPADVARVVFEGPGKCVTRHACTWERRFPDRHYDARRLTNQPIWGSAFPVPASLDERRGVRATIQRMRNVPRVCEAPRRLAVHLPAGCDRQKLWQILVPPPWRCCAAPRAGRR